MPRSSSLARIRSTTDRVFEIESDTSMPGYDRLNLPIAHGRMYSPGVVDEPMLSRPVLRPCMSRTALSISSAIENMRLA